MKPLSCVALLVLVVAACTSVFFVHALKPSSTGAFVFLATWLVLPYIAMGAALARSWKTGRTGAPVVAVLVSMGGMAFLADAIFWRPDAQGAIAVLMTPILQGGASALLVPLVAWAVRQLRH